jgi:hypothetical protein
MPGGERSLSRRRCWERRFRAGWIVNHGHSTGGWLRARIMSVVDGRHADNDPVRTSGAALLIERFRDGNAAGTVKIDATEGLPHVWVTLVGVRNTLIDGHQDVVEG